MWVSFECSLSLDLLPVRLLLCDLAAKLVVTSDQFKPELLQLLTGNGKAQTSLLQCFEGLLTTVLLLPESLKATVALGG